jgi:hypothetical protein
MRSGQILSLEAVRRMIYFNNHNCSSYDKKIICCSRCNITACRKASKNILKYEFQDVHKHNNARSDYSIESDYSEHNCTAIQALRAAIIRRICCEKPAQHRVIIARAVIHQSGAIQFFFGLGVWRLVAAARVHGFFWRPGGHAGD